MAKCTSIAAEYVPNVSRTQSQYVPNVSCGQSLVCSECALNAAQVWFRMHPADSPYMSRICLKYVWNPSQNTPQVRLYKDDLKICLYISFIVMMGSDS